jgi:hypothetical protein
MESLKAGRSRNAHVPQNRMDTSLFGELNVHARMSIHTEVVFAKRGRMSGYFSAFVTSDFLWLFPLTSPGPLPKLIRGFKRAAAVKVAIDLIAEVQQVSARGARFADAHVNRFSKAIAVAVTGTQEGEPSVHMGLSLTALSQHCCFTHSKTPR